MGKLTVKSNGEILNKLQKYSWSDITTNGITITADPGYKITGISMRCNDEEGTNCNTFEQHTASMSQAYDTTVVELTGSAVAELWQRHVNNGGGSGRGQPYWLCISIVKATYNVTYQYANEAPATAEKAPSDTGDYEYGQTVTVLATPKAVDGYKFSGWYYNANNVTTTYKTGDTFEMPANDVTLIGVWTEPYTVSYDADGGSPEPADETYFPGKTVTVSSVVPTKEGYTFAGWKKGNDIVTTFEMPAADVTLVAQWTKNPEKYNVTYSVSGDVPAGYTVPIDSNKYEEGVTVTVADVPNATGYTFYGWTSADATVGENGTFTMPAKNVTITGVWTKNDDIIINYESADTTMGTVTNASETLAPVTGEAKGSTAQAKTGYHFVNWTKDGEKVGDDEEYIPAKVDGLNVLATYVAHFAPNTDTKYTVEHYLQNVDGTYPSEATETENESGTTGTTATYKQKTCTGFTYNEFTTNKGDNSLIIAADGSLVIKLYYIRNTHTVTYLNDDGTVISEKQYKYGETVTVPEDPTKAEDADATYKFNGWVLKSGTALGAGNICLGDAVYEATFVVERSKSPDLRGEKFVSSIMRNGVEQLVNGEVPTDFVAQVGDVITWSLKLVNPGDKAVTINLSKITDTLKDAYGNVIVPKNNPYADMNITINIGYGDAKQNSTTLAGIYRHTVTAADKGKTLVNYIEVPGIDEEIKSNEEIKVVDPDPAKLSVTKWITSIGGVAPVYNEDGTLKTTAKVGDEIVWNFKITNTGETSTQVFLKDILKIGDKEITTELNEDTIILGGGASFTLANAFKYTVQVSDAEKTIYNTVIASDDKGNTAPGDSPAIKVDPAVIVEKTVNKTTANVGDTLVYTIIVKNNSSIDLEKLTVVDEMLNKTVTIENLKKGGSWTAKYEYVVKAADAGNSLINTVVVKSDDQNLGEDDSPKTEIKKNDPITPVGPPKLNYEDHYAYIVGYPDGLVHPEKNITRAEVATIFFRMLLDESREYFWAQENDFSDVAAADWFNNAVSTLANANLINGYPDGSYRPNNNITRAEFATIAIRFFLDEDVEIEENNLSDVKDHWAEANINLAYALGLIEGYPDDTFRPDQLITRAEAMTIVNRVLKRAPHEDHLLEDMIEWPDNMDEDMWYYADVQEATNSHEFYMYEDKKEDEEYEIWTELLPVRDWAALEREWSEANSSKNPGEVVDINISTPEAGNEGSLKLN